jgi:hypothetical protein
MIFVQRQVLLVLLLCAAGAWAQSGTVPQVGYLYPAGGQQGTVVKVTVGGQLLRGAKEVYVSGEGVEASVVEYMRPPTNINKDVRDLIQKHLKEVRDMRIAELEGKTPNPPVPAKKDAPEKTDKDTSKVPVKMPQHPLLQDLDSKSLRELANIANVIFMPRTKLQMNRQLAEMVLVEVKISPDAEAGKHELRIVTANGISNPMVFDVGSAKETQELEPNDGQAYPPIPNVPNGVKLPEEKAVEIPAVFNGQIMPGDVDRFRFRAAKGRQLVIHGQARSLIPYLADAVPGWFQATLALYDAKGNEVAYADDYEFDPDPVLFYQIPRDGEYELEIRDSLYRGREDFVYRISVGEEPFITGMFPLGAKAGEKTVASVDGWNLPLSRLELDTGGETGMRQTVYRQGKRVSNPVMYAVDDLPECSETESNNTLRQAQEIELPKIINGRIDQEGDIDVYKFSGSAGETVVAEVYARRLNSPLDSLLRLTDSSGSVLQWNDDFEVQQDHLYEDERGLVTHHADSYLSAKLPKDGIYYVHLGDAQNHGGKSYGYRVRISRPMPDFALRITPSSLSVRAGAIIPVCAHVMRKDGFDGEIEIVTGEGSGGFKVSGGLVPAGCDRICITVEAPANAPNKPVPLELVGRAKVGERTISRRAVAADDTMQAYLYRHLVCADELLVAVADSKYRVPEIQLAEEGRVEIPAGGTVEVVFKSTSRSLERMKFEMRNPPEGLTLQGTSAVAGGLKLRLKADKDIAKSGLEDNLLFEGFNEYMPKAKEGQPAPKKTRASAGYLPAVPIRIVEGKASATGA